MIYFGRAAFLLSKPGIKSQLLSFYKRLFGEIDPHSLIRWRAIWPMIEKAEKTLDVGCGNGIFTFDLAKKANGNVIGLTYIKKELEYSTRLKEAYELRYNKCNVDFLIGDILELEKLDTLFGQVLCVDVIEHIENDKEAFSQMYRVLKPGGCLVLSTITKEYPKYFGYKFHRAIGHVREGYSLRDLRQLLEAVGFEVEETIYHSKSIAKPIGILFYKREILRAHPLVMYVIHPLLSVLSLLDPVFPNKNPLGIAVKARKVT